MISLKWINVWLWTAMGVINLLKPRTKVIDMKISYGITWAVLMVNLIARAMDV